MPKINNTRLMNTPQTKKNESKLFIQKRLKNYILWISVVAMLTQMSVGGLIELPNNFEEIAKALLNVLVLLGIINNPTTNSQSLFVDEDLNGNGIPDHLE